MSTPPLSKFLPPDAELPSSGALAVRVERDGDGVRVMSFRPQQRRQTLRKWRFSAIIGGPSGAPTPRKALANHDASGERSIMVDTTVRGAAGGCKPIITREQAQAAGLVRYYTGRLCKYGHDSERATISTRCLHCKRLTKRKLYWADPAKFRGESRTWKASNPDKAQAARKADYEKNRERYIARAKDWCVANPERVRLRSAAWVKANAEARRKITARYRQAHPEIGRIHVQNRRARVLAVGGSFTAAEVASLGQRQRWRCAEPTCRVDIKRKFHCDHIVPLVLGGSNSIRNIQLLCPPCNLNKNAQHPIDWAQKKGRLL